MTLRWRDIAILLFIPAFMLAGGLNLERLLAIDFPYDLFNGSHIVLFIVVWGIVAVLTYKGASNVLAFFTKIGSRTKTLISYLFTLIVLSVGACLSLKYVWSEMEAIAQNVSVNWPATFNSQFPVVVYAKSFVFDTVVAVAILVILMIIGKKLFKKEKPKGIN